MRCLKLLKRVGGLFLFILIYGNYEDGGRMFYDDNLLRRGNELVGFVLRMKFL